MSSGAIIARGRSPRSWTLASLVGTLWAVHPLYWHLRRELRLAQDFLADDRAAGGDSPEAFAAYLVRLARTRRDRAHFPSRRWASATGVLI